VAHTVDHARKGRNDATGDFHSCGHAHSLAEIPAFGKSTIKSSIARPRLIWKLAPDPDTPRLTGTGK
jgi:hypothetical protein